LTGDFETIFSFTTPPEPIIADCTLVPRDLRSATNIAIPEIPKMRLARRMVRSASGREDCCPARTSAITSHWIAALGVVKVSVSVQYVVY
jgi:hypothetical protein